MTQDKENKSGVVHDNKCHTAQYLTILFALRYDDILRRVMINLCMSYNMLVLAMVQLRNMVV
jgi:hypothetical protein